MPAKLKRRLSAVPATAPAYCRPPTGGDSLENHERTMYQSARVTGGKVPPLPLTEAQAWAEAEAMTRKERNTHE